MLLDSFKIWSHKRNIWIACRDEKTNTVKEVILTEAIRSFAPLTPT